jgi:F-type H+-transporting ATPase subunit epsilon
MTAYRRKFSCDVFTPTGPVCCAKALSVTLPAIDGLVGILGGRAPLVASLGAGPLTIDRADGGRSEYFVVGGFAQVRENILTVLAERCTPAGQLDSEAVWEEISAARSMPTDTPAQRSRRDVAIRVAQTKFKIAQAHRRRTRRLAARDFSQE